MYNVKDAMKRGNKYDHNNSKCQGNLLTESWTATKRPKFTDFTDETVAIIVSKLNNRPIKAFGFAMHKKVFLSG